MSETDGADASITPQALMGYHELLGMHVVEWEEGRAVVELTIEPKHLNRSGNVISSITTLCSSTAAATCTAAYWLPCWTAP